MSEQPHLNLLVPGILPERLNMAVFASGTGTNFRALSDAARAGALGTAEPMLLLCNRDCPAMDIAREKGIPAYAVLAKDFDSHAAWETRMLDILHAFEIDFLALAGYMRVVGPTLLNAFPDRILNLHPALLPAYPGMHSIERVWDDAHADDPQLVTAAQAAAGVTVHLVDEQLDHGKILAQQAVPVANYGSLAAYEQAVHDVEHALYPQVVAQFSGAIKRQQKTGTPYWLRRARARQETQ